MDKTIDFIKKYITNNSCLIVATSGGPDSMCLLSLLCKEKKDKNLHIICAHVNHKIRLESDTEALMVEDFCKKNNITFELYEIKEFKTSKFSEELARKKRYEFFNKLIKKYDANYLLTAHHGDDLIETILMRLTRGSTLSGYKGISLITKNESFEILRPLLYTTKDDILKYLKKEKIEYAIDKSNNDLKYTRNRYRHNVLPNIKKEDDKVHLKYLKFSEELNEYDEFINEYIKSKKIIVDNKIDINKINNESNLIKRKSIELLIKEIQKKDILDISDKNMRDIIKLINNPNKSIDLKSNYKAINSYGFLKIEKNNKEVFKSIVLDESIKVDNYTFTYNTNEFLKSNDTIALLSKEITLPLRLRSRKNGDLIELKNLGTKKVNDVFIDSKIPKEKRDAYPILVDANDLVLWIPLIKKSKFSKDKTEKYDIIIKCEARWI